MSYPVSTILVPQGAEYQAVWRAGKHLCPAPSVLPIPAGPFALTQHFKQLQADGKTFGARVLLLGLCGGLTPRHAIGDVVLYQDCLYSPPSSFSLSSPPPLPCDRPLTEHLRQRLGDRVSLVRAITSDRVISLATEKIQLAQTYNVDVVDMEGYVALKFLSELGIAVAMVRVVSDDYQHDLPNLSNVFNAAGSLQLFSLITAMLRQPIAAIHLIQGSLQGLTQLTKVARALLTD